MWIPCNFGEKVIAREFTSSKYQEYYFIGITKGLFNKIDYLFSKTMTNPTISLSLEDKDKISYIPQDVTNDALLKQDSLNPIEIDLKLIIDQCCTYRDYFDTKSGKSGRLSSIILKDNGYNYTFLEHNLTPVTFVVDKLLI